MSDKYVKKKIGRKIYDETNAEYDSAKYRKKICDKWVSNQENVKPNFYAPTIISSEHHRQHTPVRKHRDVFNTPNEKKKSQNFVEFNFDHEDPIQSFFDQKNQLNLATNNKPDAPFPEQSIFDRVSKKKIANDDDFFAQRNHYAAQNDTVFSEQKKSMTQSKQYRHSTQPKHNSRMEPTQLCTDPSKLEHHEKRMGNQSRQIMSNQSRRIDDKHKPIRNENHSQRKDALIEKQSLVKREPSPMLISSKYELNVLFTPENEQRSAKPSIEHKRKHRNVDDFEFDFEELDAIQPIHGDHKAVCKKLKHEDDIPWPDNHNFFYEFNRKPATTTTTAAATKNFMTLTHPPSQPIIYNIKCNNLIIKSD